MTADRLAPLLDDALRPYLELLRSPDDQNGKIIRGVAARLAAAGVTLDDPDADHHPGCPGCEHCQCAGVTRKPIAPPALDVERLREAAQAILDRCLDVFDPDDLDPESSFAMPVTLKARWVYTLRAALATDDEP